MDVPVIRYIERALIQAERESLPRSELVRVIRKLIKADKKKASG